MSASHLPGRRLAVAALGALLLAPLALAAPAVAAEDPPTAGAPLISTAGTTWSYLDDNTEPQGAAPDVLAWTLPSYDASAWNEANGSFGALRGAIGELSGGFTPSTLVRQYVNGSSNPVIPTYFFRTEFEIESLDRLASLEGRLTFDDAVRVYLNGTLVYNDRDDRATDATKNLQYAGTSAAAPVTRTFTLDPEALAPGTLREGANTIAVTLYQDRESSSDIYFDFVSLTPFLTPAVAEPDGESQQLQVTVADVGPGEFVWSIEGGNALVDLGTAAENGDHFLATGTINPVRVTDTRTGAPEWTVSGQVSDFAAGAQSFGGDHLGWTPVVTDDAGGAVAGSAVQSGFLGGNGLADASTLGGAPLGHALGSSLLGADLELRLPTTVASGIYTGTLTLTALG